MADESQWFKFRPSDEQIFGYYLKRLLTKGTPLPAMARGVIREIDIYGEVPPWEIAKQFPESSRDNFYVFTKLVKLSTNRVLRTAKSGKGTWKGQSKKKDIEASGWGSDVVGEKKCLSFMMDAEGQPQGTKKKQVTSHWNITEYSLTKINGNKLEDGTEAYVICHVTNSNRSSSSLAQEAHNNTVNADTLRSIRAKRPKPNPKAHAGHLQHIGHTALPAREDDARFGVYFETAESSSPCSGGGSGYDQLWVGYDHDGQLFFRYDQQQRVNEGAVGVHQFHTGEPRENSMRLDTVVDDATAAAGGSGTVIAARGEDGTTTTENNNNNTESTTWQQVNEGAREEGHHHDGQLYVDFDDQQRQVNEVAVAVHQSHTVEAGDQCSVGLDMDIAVDDVSTATEKEKTTTETNNYNRESPTTWTWEQLQNWYFNEGGEEAFRELCADPDFWD